MNGSLDRISCLLVRNPNLPCELFCHIKLKLPEILLPRRFSMPIRSSLLPSLHLSLLTIIVLMPTKFRLGAPVALGSSIKNFADAASQFQAFES